MPKFDPNKYFAKVWDARDQITSSLPTCVSAVGGIVAALGGGGGADGGKGIGSVTIETRCASGKAFHQLSGYGGVADTKPNGLHIVMLAEDHGDRTDMLRGQDVGRRLGISPYVPTLVLYEKGLSGKYPVPSVAGSLVVREEDIAPHFGASIKQRSVVAAGYLVLCLMSGLQNEKIVLFFGEEHQDIFTRMEEIAPASLKARYRYYQVILSYTTHRGEGLDPDQIYNLG